MHSRVPHEPAGAVTVEVTDAPASAPGPRDGLPAAERLDDTGPVTAPPSVDPSSSTPTATAPPSEGRHPARRPARPTLWMQGHHPGRLVLRATSLILLAVLGLNLLVTGSMGLGFDLAFVAACAVIALWVRPRDFFMIGVFPPIFLGVVVIVLGIADPASVARASDNAGQAVVSGLAHQAQTLVLGYGLTLAVIALRQVAIRNGGRLRVRR
ncbi:hypothetical protein G7072_15030 [Nocardioides sp. HDW12B]|uniref:DUF6542 domain-containing protein n=1 Tax=Nocardioides sp. HDW12B TaxID=2714939 RepID=UPI00140E38CB|nr:DUF6542 domain-containing protein [Nocardioides sp. HDW12B]QIK67484.1 hypothetical protein G7072_15030 [Nocardioides sp. HDW12B]